MRVRDVMTTALKTVGPETSLKDVAAILSEFRISGLPVVDGEGRVLGVVSERDILVKARGAGARRRGFLDRLLRRETGEGEAKLAARTAGEVMTAPAITIALDRSLSEAAGLMIDHEIKRLPVLEDGKLVGIVTRADLVRAFARPDEEIAREIREDLAERTLLIPRDAVTVEVSRGDVTLRGALDRRSAADLLRTMAERVPDVVSVRSTLTWRWDNYRDRPHREHEGLREFDRALAERPRM